MGWSLPIGFWSGCRQLIEVDVMDDLSREAWKAWSDFLWMIIRKENLTQKALARKLGVSQSRVNTWLNGSRLPSLSTIVYACQVLKYDFTVREEGYNAGSGNR